MDFRNKKIILIVPDHFGLPARFKRNLEYWGFDVFSLPEINVYLPIVDKIIHGYKKIIHKDKSYKSKAIAELKEKYYIDSINNMPLCDYALIIRPDLISPKVIRRIKEKSRYIAAYQWDGMNRYPIDNSIIEFFDRFFVFDKKDTDNYSNCTHITNFYFDDLVNIPIEKEVDVFFVGTYMEDRISQLLSLSTFFKESGYTTNFNLVNAKNKYILNQHNINCLEIGFSFTENILNLKKSQILLDFKNNIHNGISFRTFESIGYKKKLITNNPLVTEYDFFNSDNIFLFEDSNLTSLDEFLRIPYTDLPKDIYEKYSFCNWLKQVLCTY